MNAEDFNRKKKIVILLTIGSSVLLFGLMITHISSYFTSDISIRIGSSLYLIPILLIGHALLYALIRKNKITVVSFALTILYTLGSVYGAYMWGISMPSALLIFSLVIALIGMLFSSRIATVATVFTCIAITFLGLREVQNPDITLWKEYGLEVVDVISYIVIICISSGLTIFSNRETEKSLRRARESEKNLEAKVEIRTNELRKAQLETLDAMSHSYELGKVAQGLFHDLITPLSTAALYVSEYDKTNTKHYIDKAVQASNRMRRMLEVTKSQINLKDECLQFSVLKEIEVSKDLLQYESRKKDVSITITSTEDLILLGVPLRFNQIISNIIQNAIDAFTNSSNNKIEIIIGQRLIQIKNNGPEIPQSILGKLFKSHITTKKDHFGIGLPTIEKIIRENFDGSIDLISSTKETVFTLHFPHAKIQSPLSTNLQNNQV